MAGARHGLVRGARKTNCAEDVLPKADIEGSTIATPECNGRPEELNSGTKEKESAPQ